ATRDLPSGQGQLTEMGALVQRIGQSCHVGPLLERLDQAEEGQRGLEGRLVQEQALLMELVEERRGRLQDLPTPKFCPAGQVPNPVGPSSRQAAKAHPRDRAPSSHHNERKLCPKSKSKRVHRRKRRTTGLPAAKTDS
ncbi:unnamed protein product, partial [Ixodes persulcatus]